MPKPRPKRSPARSPQDTASPTLGTKAELKAELEAQLAAQVATLRASYAAAREGATHAEAKPEHDKDTRALEQSYLARGQAARLEDLLAGQAALKALQTADLAEGAPVGLGALVTLEDAAGERSQVYLAPTGGGGKLAGGAVLVTTPKSPLGQALIGRTAGDSVEVGAGPGKRELAIVGVG